MRSAASPGSTPPAPSFCDRMGQTCRTSFASSEGHSGVGWPSSTIRSVFESLQTGDLRAGADLADHRGVGVFRPGGARPPSEVTAAFIDAHRGNYGVEPIRAVLPLARRRTTTRTERAGTICDGAGCGPCVTRSCRARFSGSGPRSSGCAVPRRSGDNSGANRSPRHAARGPHHAPWACVARCAAERCARRSPRTRWRVMRSRPAAVPRHSAQTALGSRSHLHRDVDGFADGAFIIDVFSRRIMGWCVAASLRSDVARCARTGAVRALALRRAGPAPRPRRAVSGDR